MKKIKIMRYVFIFVLWIFISLYIPNAKVLVKKTFVKPYKTVFLHVNKKKIYIKIFTPKYFKQEDKYPALILVPPGISQSIVFDIPANDFYSVKLANLGFIVITYDPQGRGLSTGKENYNGPENQDNLRHIIEYVAKLKYVDIENIGIIGFLWGGVVVNATLSSYPFLPVKYIIDISSPIVHKGLSIKIPGYLDKKTFWVYRVSQPYSDIRPIYIRIQCKDDTPYKKELIAYLNKVKNSYAYKVYLNYYDLRALKLPFNINTIDKYLLKGKFSENHDIIFKYLKKMKK